MKSETAYRLITYFAAVVWFVNGLICKVLNQVPRHQEIVESILSIEHGKILTIAIGISEILMAVWILSKLFPRLNVIVQAGIIMLMNVIEQVLAGELLLWGKFNFIFALAFSLLILYNEFVIKKKVHQSLKTSDA